MTNKNIKLGKNLTALLGDLPFHNTTTTAKGTVLQEIEINLLKKGKYQPRNNVDNATLTELAESIKAQGIIQPIVVRQINNDYEILAGERRWRAAQLAGLKKVPVTIKNVSDQEALAIALIENIQRENLNIIEEANAIQQLISEFSLTHQEVAAFIGKNRTTITNTLRLLSLHNDVKELIHEGKLEMGHARALLALPHPLQIRFAKTIIEKLYTVRQIEALVKNHLYPRKEQHMQVKINNFNNIEKELSNKFDSKIKIYDKNGSGKIVFTYQSQNALNQLLITLNKIK